MSKLTMSKIFHILILKIEQDGIRVNLIFSIFEKKYQGKVWAKLHILLKI